MAAQSWVLNPGERYNIQNRMETTIQSYLELHPNEHYIVSSEDEETIYFLKLNEQGGVGFADVAMFSNDEYHFLPQDRAFELATVYMQHIRLLADAYDFLEEEQG